MKKILPLLLCGLLTASFTSCVRNESASSSAEETVTEAVTETTAETTESPAEPTTEAITEPKYFSQLVYPDTMTEKEKSGTYYRELTILDADKAYEIGEHHTAYGMTTDRPEWAKAKKIEDSFREMKIYDEQLDTDFLVHITLPPDYDESREYPVFFLTDSEYWFGSIPDMHKIISKDQASPVIFVTLGRDYDVQGFLDELRFDKFVTHQEEMLDFITNDLMQLISLNYKTDASRSVFFGHSLGGLFSHYALCNSDKYEYQPFQNYVIASPALWTYYYDGEEGYGISDIPDPHAFEREFGYFDRNETMDKNVFICAGGSETYHFDAPDLPTIPEDAQSLYDRLTAHGVNAEFTLYDGQKHLSYVKNMLKDYLKQTFPPENAAQEQ